jgi:ribonuclease VapC
MPSATPVPLAMRPFAVCPTFVESSIVVESQTGDDGSRQWDQFFRRAGFVLEPVTEEQAYAARQAWSNFGKVAARRNSISAILFSYALAKTLGEPLLLEGAYFSQTDVSPAI